MSFCEKIDIETNTGIGKIFSNFIFWLWVALSFPVVGFIANKMEITHSLDTKLLFEITKYFDIKLFIGLAIGCVIYYLMAKIVGYAKSKFCKTKTNNVTNDALEEISSQIIGIGSIIIATNLTLFIFKNLIASLKDINTSVTNYWWLGVICCAAVTFFWTVG